MPRALLDDQVLEAGLDRVHVRRPDPVVPLALEEPAPDAPAVLEQRARELVAQVCVGAVRPGARPAFAVRARPTVALRPAVLDVRLRAPCSDFLQFSETESKAISREGTTILQLPMSK